MAIAKKMRQFAATSSWIRKMFEEGTRLKQEFGADNVFDFSLGNPDLPPPEAFSRALRQEAAKQGPGLHGYMANAGFAATRAAVAARVSREQGVAIEEDGILMTCGAAGGMNVALKAILDPGDQVIVLAPFFVEYHFYIDNHGGEAVVVPTAPDFSLDLEAIRLALSDRTKAIIINSPNNPSGQVYAAAELQGLGELLQEKARQLGRAVYLLADEPYRAIAYDTVRVPGVFAAYPDSIVVTSFSKDLSLAGERIGFVAAHPAMHDRNALLGAMTLANRILGFVNAPALMQRVVGQLQDVTVDTGIYARRRDRFARILELAGYDFLLPRGGFYFFPKSPIPDDVRFVGLLQEERILGVPGRGFGTPGHFRLAFCVDDRVIENAADGFRRAMERANGASRT